MQKIKDWILKKLFKVSNQPVNLLDLLEANALFNEKMSIDPAKLHFKFQEFNAYLIFAVLCAIVLVPLILLTHSVFQIIDFHLSIISAIGVTAAIFIFFDMFKIYTRKSMTKRLIKKAWNDHFPCFEYEKYSKLLEEIYHKLPKHMISKPNLESYVLEQIIQNEKKL